MSTARLEQLVAESHPHWSGFAPDLLVLAARSDAGRRLVLRTMADRLNWPLQRLSPQQQLFISERQWLRSGRYCVTSEVDCLKPENGSTLAETSVAESRTHLLGSLSDLCWQASSLLLPRLMVLGSLFYVQQIRVEIRKDSVRAWKNCLSEDGYRTLLKEIQPVSVSDFDVARQRHQFPTGTELIDLDVEASRKELMRYGMALLLGCLAVSMDIDGIIGVDKITEFEQCRVRLRSVLPAEPEGLVEGVIEDERMFNCFADVMRIVQLWHPQESLL